MSRMLSLTLLLCGISIAHAQTGINTDTPKATFDIKAVDNASIPDGIIAPRVSGDRLFGKTYTADQNGAIVYIDALPVSANQTGQTEDVKFLGYYYFDSTKTRTDNGFGKWVKLYNDEDVRRITGLLKPDPNIPAVSTTVAASQRTSEVFFTSDTGIILRSTNGTYYLLTVNDDGSFKSTKVYNSQWP